MSTIKVGDTRVNDEDADDCSWEATHVTNACNGSSTDELFNFGPVCVARDFCDAQPAIKM
jgi:hypothetical protein